MASMHSSSPSSPTSSAKGIGKELSAHITSLETALGTIAATKRHLSNNAAQAKSRIHSMMSRQLEALRTREVWLLGQVELLHDTKDSLLRQQADALSQTLGALTTYRQYLEAGEPGDLENTIQDTIDRLSKLELSPLETRHLTFQADLASLRDAIRNFGRVETHGGGQGAAEHMGWSAGDSRSLPRAFEEYEDEEEDAMYCKTVQDISSAGGCTQRNINVNVPKLKAQPSDWLFLPPDVQPPPKQPASRTLPLFKSDLSQWLLREPAEAKASVQHWLQEIQSHTEEDDDDDELIRGIEYVAAAVAGRNKTISTSSSFDVLSLPGSAVTTSSTATTTAYVTASSTTATQPQSCSYFAEVSAAPAHQWLTPAAAGDRQQQQQQQPDNMAMKYFAELSRHSSQQWLLNQQDGVGCCKGSTVSICPPVSPDIEDLDLMTCTQPAPASPPASKPQDDDAEKDVDEREEAVRNNINQLCRANEVCHTFTDCVCDDNCASDASPKSPMKAWLARPSSLQNLNDEPAFDYFNMVTGSKPSEWLAQDSQKAREVPVDAGLYPPFQSNSSNSSWLLHSESSSEATCPFVRSRNSPTSQWISGDSPHPAFRPSPASDQWLASPSPSPSPSRSTAKSNPWLATSPQASTEQQGTTTDRLKEYLDQAQPQYTWSLTRSDNSTSMSVKSHDEKPLPKKLELPECDNKESYKSDEASKWLMVLKEEKETSEGNTEQGTDLFPLFAQNKAALGEWLMNVHSDF